MNRLQITDYRLQMGIFALFSVLCSLFSVCFAQSISSADLINNAKLYDGKTVTYAGEVIGDVMARGNYAWVNVLEGQSAVGIWVEKDLTKDIHYMGKYHTRGDGVEVEGVFHRACFEHGGDLDIHAQKMRKIKSGSSGIEKLDYNALKSALGLLALLGAVSLLKRRKP